MKRALVGGVLLLVALGGVVFSLRGGTPERSPASTAAPDAGSGTQLHARLRPPPVVAPPPAPGQLAAALFEGDVVTPEGKGIAGAELVLEYRGAAATTHADARGHFVFAAEPPGEWSLGAISAEGYAPYAPPWGESSIRLLAARGALVEDLQFVLVPEEVMAGRVEDDHGRPVAQARVELPTTPVTVGEASWTATSEDGAFKLRVPRADDPVIIEVAHPAFGGLITVIRREDYRDGGLVVRLARYPQPEEMPRPFAIYGVVLDEDDAGVPGAALTTWLVPGDEDWPGLTDAAGRFSFGVADAGVWHVAAEATGYGGGIAQTVVPSGAPVVVRVRRDTGRLSGQVTAADGHPVQRFVVWTAARELALGADRPQKETFPGPAWRQHTFFSGNGHFDIDKLPVGTVRVVVSAPGFRPSGTVPVDLPPGQKRHLVITLLPGAAVSGVVRDRESRAALAGVEVAAGGHTRAPPSAVPSGNGVARTDSDGRFVLVGLAPGPTDIDFRDPRRRYVRRELSSVVVPETGGLPDLAVDLERAPEGEPETMEYEGIGADLDAEPSDAGPVIGGFRPGAGAATAGLRIGDVITAVDGTPLAGLDVDEAIPLIKGPEGSLVRLTILRDGTSFEVTAVRRRLAFPTRARDDE